MSSTYPSVVDICARLIAHDSSNYGAAGSKGERAVADYVVGLLRNAGYQPTMLESAPTRANVLLRVAGTDSHLPGLMVHGHLDVVPAEREQWSVDPFAGLVRDGYVWGRGATDMKDAVATTLSVLLRWSETGVRPRRDVVFAFVADEEEDGAFGAQWLVDNHPGWFKGVAAAIGESGGAPVSASDADGKLHRFYPVGAGERGTLHMTLHAAGTSGHGSRATSDSAIMHLVDAVRRIDGRRWPVTLPAAARAFLEGTTETLGIRVDLSTEQGMEAALEAIGDDLGAFVRPASRCSVNVTGLRAGYKVNVLPGSAQAELDVRSVPGREEWLLAEIDGMLGSKVSREFISNHPGVAAPVSSYWFSAISEAVRTFDPAAVVLPFCMGGGTDAKAFSTLGIDCYGFSPLGPDPEGRVGSGMHGVDERVPVAALECGVDILERFLTDV